VCAAAAVYKGMQLNVQSIFRAKTATAFSTS